jgi:UDP-N-acetylmuramate--alanine ligase
VNNTLDHIAKAYFLGIGGIGMSALARYFHGKGVEVKGYDKTETQLTKELVQEGISVSYFDNPSSLPNWLQSDVINDDVIVIYTPAIPKDHCELNFLKDKGVRLWKRSEVLGAVTSGTRTIAVAGTHGKTTTSTIIAHILKHSGKNVTAFLGGISSNYQTNLLVSPSGIDEVMVAEADEYDKSFLQLNPDVSVVTSLDPDHLDIYGNHDNMVECYSEFANRLKPGGSLYFKAGSGLKHTANNSYSYSAFGQGDYCVSNIRIDNGAYVFDILGQGLEMRDMVLYCPGRHNVENALVACIVCLKEGLTPDDIRVGLASFKGVHRRFEYRLREHGKVVIDDYAHHPTELTAAINTVRELYPNKNILGIFQPHLYSRTRDFAEGFAKSLSLLDALVLLDIYPARELPIPGVSSQMILNMVTAHTKVLLQKDQLFKYVSQSESDVVLILGAGDIDALVVGIVESVRNKNHLNPQSV